MSFNQLKIVNKTAFFTAAFLFLGTLFPPAHITAKEPNPSPVAEMTQTTVNFPPVIAGKTVEHGFLVKNNGLANLNILNVYTG
jgi:hypothetical protein